jgi:hypothetical protein
MQQRRANWDLLAPGAPFAADIHLLCEASVPPRGVNAIGQWRTVGLADALPLDRPVRREWSTGVAATTQPVYVTDARTAREYKDRPSLPFKPSRPGSWTAARVTIGRTPITVIALYGLLDERSDASVHRSLSEMSPIFEHARYSKNLILGGDLNIFANPHPDDPARARHFAVLARIEAYGLTDLLSLSPRPASVARDDPCHCGERRCRHWRTYRRSPRAPGRAYQEDFLFASAALVRRLVGCRTLPFQPTSDHAPVWARFS